MIIKNWVFTFFLFFNLSAEAQLSAQNLKLSGRVVDSLNQPLPKATVRLTGPPAAPAGYQTVTGQQGEFTFPGPSAGNYRLTVSMVGYRTYEAPVTVQQADVQLSIRLVPLAVSLKEVSVTAKQQLMEMQGGKLIYNVAQSPAATGSNAFDLLRRTPGVNVGPDENLTLKGSAQVNVLVDGKMTYLSAQQLTQMLKGMNAEQISRIEVTSTPGAQYDAAGNAGMINIVTKRSNRLGYALNIGSGINAGRYIKPQESLSGNLKTAHWNFYGALAYSPYHSYSNRYNTNSSLINGVPTVVDRQFGQPVMSEYYTYKGGIEWTATDRQAVSVSYTGSTDKWSKNAGGNTYLRYADGQVFSRIQTQSVAVEPYYNNAFNLDYRLKLDTSGRLLTADADYIAYRNFSDGYLGTQAIGTGGVPVGPYERLQMHQPSFIHIYSIKSDLELPFQAYRFKAGLKYAQVKSDNNFRYDSLRNGTYQFAPTLSDHFVYTERITAGYASLSRQWKHTSAEGGLRVENTYSRGEAMTIDSVVLRRYTNLFPFLMLMHNWGDQHKLSLSVSRRINRPSYSNLNPIRYYQDKYSYYSGTPNLLPEKAWIAELTYAWLDKYIGTLSYNRLNDFIGQYIMLDPASGTVISQNQNFPHKDRWDAVLIVPVKLSNRWELNSTTDLSYTTYPVMQLVGLKNAKRINVNLNVNQTYSLPKNYLIELSATYVSGELNGIYLTHYYYQIDGGVRKSLLNKKLDVRLAFTDLLRTNRYWGSTVTNLVDYTYKYVPDNRKVSLSLVYHLGGRFTPGKSHRIEEQDRL